MNDSHLILIAVFSVTAIAIASLFYARFRRRRGAGVASPPVPIEVKPPQPMRIELGTEGTPLLVIRSLDLAATHSISPINLEAGTLSKLSLLLQQAPAFAVNVATAGQKMFELTFSPDVLKGLQDDSLALKKSLEGGFRAMVQNDAGKIVAHGSLKPMALLKATAAAAAVWQVLSVAVAQKHLADINQKLKEISAGITGLQSCLHHEQRGKLEGNLDYLNNLATCLLDGALAENELATYRVNLEDIERESIQILRSIELEIVQFQGKLADTQLNEWFGTKNDTEALRSRIQEHERLAKSWLLAMHVRAAACQISCALPGEQPVAERRLLAIRKTLSTEPPWAPSNCVITDLVSTKLNSPWNTANTLALRRKSLLADLDSAEAWLAQHRGHVKTTLETVEETIRLERIELNRPMKLAVELDSSGQVVRVGKLNDG